MNRHEELKIINDKARKDLIRLYRKYLSRVATLNTSPFELDYEITTRTKGLTLHLTVHDGAKGNRTLTLYDFDNINKCEELLKDYIKAIKAQDFKRVAHVASLRNDWKFWRTDR